MNRRMGHGFQKLIVAGCVIFFVQLACGSVASTDPRIPVSLNNMMGQFDPLLRGLQIIPAGIDQPPQIMQIQSGSGNQPGLVSGLGSFGLPTKIRLYRVQLLGCGKELLRGDLLAETTTDATGMWSIPHNLKPGEVVAATQVLEGKETGLSNMRVNIDESEFLKLDNAEELQQAEYEVSALQLLRGSSFPGACVVLQNHNMEYGRVGSVTTSENGKWEIDVPLLEGDNKYRLYVEGWEEIEKELLIRGFFPRMQWPIGRLDETAGYVPDYKFSINGFYGKNDFYTVNGLFNGFHDGIDVDADAGTPILAVADGDVFYVQIDRAAGKGDGGNIIFIDHGGWFSLYMHLAKITIDGLSIPASSKYYDPIQEQNHVLAGEKIGEAGNTGCWVWDKINKKSEPCGIHLHFSAFGWNEGNRLISIKKKPVSSFAWSQYGRVLNINPKADKILRTGEQASDRLGDFASDFDYWLVNWRNIPIWEPGCPSGTNFGELIFDNVKGVYKCE